MVVAAALVPSNDWIKGSFSRMLPRLSASCSSSCFSLALGALGALGEGCGVGGWGGGRTRGVAGLVGLIEATGP